MIYAFFAPESALQSNFGESVSGPVASIVVRNWGAHHAATQYHDDRQLARDRRAWARGQP